MRIQADITTFFIDNGNQFSINGICTPLSTILEDLCISTVRLAVFSLEKPMYDYRSALEYVRTSRKKLFLDIHCSDTWADPSHQSIPFSWDFRDIDGLRRCFLNYISDVCDLIKKSEVEVEYIQVGNEISNGMLWPYLNDLNECARFLKAAIFQIREIFPKAKIVLHTDLSGAPEKAIKWYRIMHNIGVTYDLIGLSFYPVWHGTIKTLKETIRRLHLLYNKPISLCEIGYMNTPQKTTAWFGEWQCDSINYTPIGQAEYLSYLVTMLEEDNDCLFPEMFYWGGFSYKSKEHFPVALFDLEGNALPAIDVICKLNQI